MSLTNNRYSRNYRYVNDKLDSRMLRDAETIKSKIIRVLDKMSGDMSTIQPSGSVSDRDLNVNLKILKEILKTVEDAYRKMGDQLEL